MTVTIYIAHVGAGGSVSRLLASLEQTAGGGILFEEAPPKPVVFDVTFDYRHELTAIPKEKAQWKRETKGRRR